MGPPERKWYHSVHYPLHNNHLQISSIFTERFVSWKQFFLITMCTAVYVDHLRFTYDIWCCVCELV